VIDLALKRSEEIGVLNFSEKVSGAFFKNSRIFTHDD